MSDTLSKNKILDWIYNGNASGFTIGEFTSLINMGSFNSSPVDDKRILEIAEECADISRYDDDDFTPPDSVPDFNDEMFWDWIQTLLKASAQNALLKIQDEN